MLDGRDVSSPQRSLLVVPRRSHRARLVALATVTALVSILASPRFVHAGPVGGTVTAGSASISQSGTATIVDQSSAKAIIDWRGFSIGTGESVAFRQPGASAVALNRVTGTETSTIAGSLTANGQVFLVNPNGILFSSTASVNVGGLVASTLDITNSDFLAGNYTFSGTSKATVVNQGLLNSPGGYVSLMGKSVSNAGTITADLGTVAMTAGEKITLNFSGNSLFDVTIDKGVLDALVENKQLIRADGGKVIMTAKAADAVLSAQVNNTGIVQARTVGALLGGGTKTGSIRIHAYGGKAKIAGRLDASAPTGGNGGTIETSGDRVSIADDAAITTAAALGTTGRWTIDPTDFSIAYGSDALTTSGIGATTLQNLLATTNVSIVTSSGGSANGDINVAAPVSWSSGNSLTLSAINNINVNAAAAWTSGTLTLNAGKNIYVNAAMTASGTAGFVANYGHAINTDGSVSAVATAGQNDNLSPYGLYMMPTANAGGYAGSLTIPSTGSVTLNGTGYTIVTDASGLAAVKTDLGGHYVLGSDISGVNWTDGIGATTPFSGIFNGLGHRVTSPTFAATGLFGTIGSGAIVSNVGVWSATVSAPTASSVDTVGALADVNQGGLFNSFASSSTVNNGQISGAAAITVAGGLVGTNSGLIAGSYFFGKVVDADIAGGLVGLNTSTGIISESFVRGSTATWALVGTADTITYAGGFVGENDGRITKSWSGNVIQIATSVTGAITGGFVGLNTGTIDQSYSNKAFDSAYDFAPNLGGFVGSNAATGTISNAYATGLYSTNSSSIWTAGFAYSNAGTIRTSYATSYAPDTSAHYGFVAHNSGTITNDYYFADGVTSFDVTDASGATALTATSAADFSSYAGFDSSVWAASPAGFAVLSNAPLYVTGGSQSYGAVTSADALYAMYVGFQGGGGISSVDDMTSLTATLDNGYVDAGAWTSMSVLSSSAYKNIKGSVVVTPATLTLLTTASQLFGNKTYDGTTAAILNSGLLTLTGFAPGQSASPDSIVGTFSDANVGTGKTIKITFTASTASGIKASNYVIADATASITAKALTLSGLTATSRVYDGTTTATTSNLSLSGVVFGDAVSVAGGYTTAFSDANVGADKTVVASGLSLTGASAGNYSIATQTVQTTAAITPLALTLSGSKTADGSTTVAASNLVVTNAVAGDGITLGGTAMIAGAGAGTQAITSLANLTQNNPNYTLVGAVGSVLVGSQSLILDHIAAGTATIATSGAATTITQASDKAIIDWVRFSIGSGESLTFAQPSATSITLNRVTGGEATTIAGALDANGRVFILNPNGVLFAAGSSVDVGALVASTQTLSDTDFMAGNYVFSVANAKGSVVAAGDIVIVDGGFLALASQNGVAASGTITARGGKAVLAAAKALTLTLNTTDSGLSGYALSDLSGATTAAGTMNLASSAGTGGRLETAGTSVDAGRLVLTTGSDGTWSWSQPSVTVGDAGLVASMLGARNVELHALAGDVTVNSALSWATDRTLTLAATGDIHINAPITAAGTNAGLTMTYGGDYYIRTSTSYAGTALNASGIPVADSTPAGTTYGSITMTGANADLTINGNRYTLISSMSQLDALDKCVNGLCYNPATGHYDVSMASVAASVSNKKYYRSYLNNNFYYFNTVTQAYDIAQTSTDSNGTTHYWNPETNAYDLASAYSGKLTNYYYDPSTGKYSVASYAVADAKYYNPSDGNYDLASMYSGYYYYYNTATKAYDKYDYDTNITKYYSPESGSYSGSSMYSGSVGTYYYDTGTGAYDLIAPNAVTGYYALAQNMDATGATYSSSLISYLSGTLTGLGHTITGLTITSQDMNLGLVGTLGWTDSYGASSIRDIGLVNVSITDTYVGSGWNGVGTLVGSSYGNVSDAYSTGRVTSSGGIMVGGLIGYETGSASTFVSVKNSYANVTVTGVSTGGGLIANAKYTNISNSHASGDVTLTGTTGGGLVANATAVNVSNSYAIGNVTGGAGSSNYFAYLGGLIGNYASGGFATSIVNSFATGNVAAGGSDMGGLIGSVSFGGGDFGILNSYATGNVTSGQSTEVSSTSTGIGGLIGKVSGSSNKLVVEKAFATGNVIYSGAIGNSAGGLIGYLSSNAAIDSSYATGNVTGSTNGTGAGGLIGTAIPSSYNAKDLTLTNVSASGNVTGNVSAGGLLGSGSATIRNATASGNVTLLINTGPSGQAGGLVGSLVGGSVTNSSATGNVTTTAAPGKSAYLGGLVGFNNAAIINSSAWGDVSGMGATTGALVGWNFNSGVVSYSSAFGQVTINGASTGNSIGKNTSTGTVGNNSYTDVKAAAARDAAQRAAAAARAAAARAEAQTAAAQAEAVRDATRAGGEAVQQTVAAQTASLPSSRGPDVATPMGAPAPIDMSKAIELTSSEAAPTQPPATAPEDNRRKVAARKNGNGGGGGRDLGATIRSMEIDGHKFDLEKKPDGDAPADMGTPAPVQTPAPAPAGGQ